MFGTKQNILQRGFTLIELLVSISVVVLVTAIVLAKQNAFDSAVLLRNQAYEVAFAIRKAQQLAVSATGDTSTKQQYGVYVNTSSAYNQSVIIFNDTNADNRYTSADTIIETVRLDRRFVVSSLNGNNTNASIVFRRPDFDAYFKNSNTVYSSGDMPIVIAPAADLSQLRTVTVTSAGQVSVD